MKRLLDTTLMMTFALAGLALGCDDKPASHAGGRVAIPSEGGDDSAPPLIGGKQGRDGRAEAPGEDPVAAREAGGGAASLEGELTSLYRSWSGEEANLLADFPARLETAIAKTGELGHVVRKVYDRLGKSPITTRDGQLTEVAVALVDLFKRVSEHGIDPAPYALEALDGLIAKLSGGPSVPPLAERDKPLWDFMVSQRPAAGAPNSSGLADKARAAGFSDADLGRLSELRKRLNLMLVSRKQLIEVLAEVDVALVARLHRYVYDMRLGKKAHPFLADKTFEVGLARVTPELTKHIEAFDWNSAATLSTWASGLVPKFPDYEPTRQALLRYRGYAERHPTHIELSKDADKLAAGRSGDLVKLLEERLIQEEYLGGSPSGKWSAALTEALSAYQETHQMKPTGKMDKATRTSLNRTFAERAKQLELSLQRYRESDLHQGAARFGEVPVRARVNIPAMEARFYLGAELARKHRVVVGNNDTETDAETGKRGKLNQTRLLSADMQTVVLNPVWNVPRRIKEQELDLMLMDEPDYYEKHGFKIEVNADGSERVVQQPGPGNALGLVKFLFPNQFSIYMHDTPKKNLFDRPVRAFSHGCMRTENPLDLARWILVEVDKDLTNEEFDAILEAREERHFAVNPRIPISTDYITTTIDEAGRINFLSDVYGFDKDFFEGNVPRPPDKDFPLTVLF
jgi:murein L,D-transpeptidase YcbB/YkuD